MPFILQIAIPGPLRQTFDYYSKQCTVEWQKGMRVRVPFGSRDLIGFVIDAKPTQEDAIPTSLKAVTESIDIVSLLPESIFELIIWTSQYYHHPIGDCFQVALPKKIRLGDAVSCRETTAWTYHPEVEQQRLGKKQQAVIDLFDSQSTLLQTDIYQRLGPCQSTLVRLAEKGILSQQKTIEMPLISNNIKQLSELNSEQSHTVETIYNNTSSFYPCLLHGITGSGKTEVYLQLALQLLAEQKQMLVLIPEIGLTDQFVSRFQQHIPGRIVIFHSGMTDNERMQSWLLAQQGHADIVIGTRSAVFMPMPRLGMIVIDEEHDSAYKQQDSLRYHAKQVALMRARQAHIPIILGSATPSLDSYYHAMHDRYHLFHLNQRATGASLPRIQLIDNTGPQHSKTGLSSVLFDAVEDTLSKQNQVLLFINQRGYAPVMMCHDCQWQAVCPDCDAKLIMHQQRYQLRCHHCGYTQRLLSHCPECQSDALGHYGLGTEQIEQRLKVVFPSVPILRIDRDSTQKVGSFSALRDQINTGEPAILVGTQMLAKGHDFHDVTLVGILDADQGLFSADFKATETLAQLITQVTGRAGRGQKTGQVYIQTQHPDHPFWQQLLTSSYQDMITHILTERTLTHMPPMSSLCLIRARNKQDGVAMTFLTELAALLQRTPQTGIMILGPVPAVMEKQAGYFRAQLLLMTNDRKALHQLLDHHMPAITRLKSANKVKWSIDVDPIHLMS